MPDEKPPSVDAVVRRIDESVLPRQLVVETVRTVVDRFREDPTLDIDAEVGRRLDDIRRSIPHRVINATGVLLHTNLGRAPWISEAVSAAAEVAGSYSNVELDLGSGERGRRNAMSERLLVALTGAEAALVVNNNAAAVFLVLAVLAGRNGRVPVSRGELIEIGGSYRLPELMAATGADLVEVGTTNRTRLEDYQAVEDACLILKVHPSNYQIVGFSNETPVSDLAGLASSRSIPLVFDDGSGLLDDRVPWLDGPPPPWLGGEPGVRQSLEAGAGLVLFSGDKLLGGPQAGLIVGKADLVDRLRKHPAARALRIDGATDAALAATLAAYLTGHADEIPLWRMATMSTEDIGRRADEVVTRSGRTDLEVVDGPSTLGAGSAPGAEIPSRLIRSGHGNQMFDRLLSHQPPILARRREGSLLIDLRTVDPADDRLVADALEIDEG